MIIIAQNPNPIDRMQNNAAYLRAQTELLKAQTKYTQEVNKSKPETWKAMTESVKELTNFGNLGGFGMLFGGSISRIQTQITSGLEGAIAPITNKISEKFNELLEGFTKLINEMDKLNSEWRSGLAAAGEEFGVDLTGIWDTAFQSTMFWSFDIGQMLGEALQAGFDSGTDEPNLDISDLPQRTSGRTQLEDTSTW